MAQKMTGALVFDERTDRYDIRFDLNSYYGGLHPIKRQCWRSSPHGRALQTLSISRTMALVVLALTVPDF